MAIQLLQGLPGGTAGSSAAAGASGQAGHGQGFVQSLAKLVSDVDQSSGEANAAVGRMLDGQGDVHEAMIALQRAEMTLQLTVQVRNKFVQAYQEIMRMPV